MRKLFPILLLFVLMAWGCGASIFYESYPQRLASATTQPQKPQAIGRFFWTWTVSLNGKLDRGVVQTPEGGKLSLSGAASTVDPALVDLIGRVLDAAQKAK